MTLRLATGEFELDEARFELRRQGVPVAVQPKVLEFIFFLAKHRDRVVHKEELMASVWDGTTVTEASLSQAVSLARKALDDSAREQRVLRTVRGRGFQFVAEPRTTATPARTPAPTAGETVSPNTELETAQEERRSGEPARVAPLLVIALQRGDSSSGGASFSLAQTDEVQLTRGSRLKVRRADGITRTLTLAIPCRLMSRDHARLLRTPDGWRLTDTESRNGTYVNGDRTQGALLSTGDVIECGRVFLLFTEADSSAPTTESNEQRASRWPSLLNTVSPALLKLEHDIERVASTSLPLLITGDNGTGKTHLVHALTHRAKQTEGASQLVSCASAGLTTDVARAAVDELHEGTLVLESVERLPTATAAALPNLLDTARGVRLISTSPLPVAELAKRIPQSLLMRLNGFCCHLPPLRERIGDLGALIAALTPTSATPGIEREAARTLLRYPWPGNIRELAHVLEAAAAVAHPNPVQRRHLPAALTSSLDDGHSVDVDGSS